MPLFSVKQNRLEQIRKLPLSLEKELQRITENNLKQVFGLEFVRTEFNLGNLRIDTLAYDKENKSFVIIEYKRDKNISIIDQGYAYLALLLNNKADFILEYNECKNSNLRRDDVDWSQSKVLFVAPEFTKYQKQAINFRDLPIELWEATKFENNIILYNRLESPETSESITKISSNSELVSKVSKEVRVYAEGDHLEHAPGKAIEVYEELKRKILDLGDNVEIRPRKKYIGFIAKGNFVDFHFSKKNVKLWINLVKGELDDPMKLARDVSNVGHWGNGDYEITTIDKEHINYIMTLIRQSYIRHSTQN